MDKPMPGLSFRVMSFLFKLRDLFKPRSGVLGEVGIGPGSRVLDYGCGPGSYSVIAAQIVGPAGRVYALDIHPLAIEAVRRATAKRGLSNVETILSGCATGLGDGSVDVVLLYDTFHDLGDGSAVLRELHRVLRPEGTLSFSDHHMSEDEITARLTAGGLFKLAGKGKSTHSFAPMK